MPLYDYECPKCGVFEAFQKVADRHKQTCKFCKGAVKLVILTVRKGRVFQEFVTDDPRTGGEVRITSKQQYKTFLDANGLFCDGYNQLRGSQEHDGKLEERKKNVACFREKMKWAEKEVAKQRAITVRT